MQTNVTTRGSLSRRGFVAGTGVLAGGVVASTLTIQARADEALAEQADGAVFSGYKAAIGHLVFDPDKCAGCRNCEIVCSMNKWGIVNSELSCIQIDTDILGGYVSEARICKQCLGPECVAACPTGALSIDEATGARVIDRDVCIGCQTCKNACPAVPSNIRYNPVANVCVKCDLCGGDPLCVQYCSGGALSVSWEEAAEDPNTYHADCGIEINVVPSGSIIVVAPDSIDIFNIDAARTADGVTVTGQLTNGYTQPFPAKIKASYFDADGATLFFSDRLEIETEIGETITFEDVFETPDPDAVVRIRLEVMCGKIAG